MMPFINTLRLKIEPVQPGYYSLLLLNRDGTISAPDRWGPLLFYKYEANFYGLTAKLDERNLIISAANFLDMLSPAYRHPFIQFEGSDAQSAEYLAEFERVVPLWHSENLWQRATLSEEGVHFEQEPLLGQAVMQRLAGAGLTMEDVPSLLPYFQNGGWPLQTRRMAGNVQVALRLSEPLEDEEEWYLETVLITPSSAKHWVPAKGKRQLPIELTLPTKWKDLAPDIEALQDQMAKLLTLPRHAPSATQFFFMPLTDHDVRHFLQHDLAKLQAMGFEIILPAWLKDLKQSKMRVRVNAGNASPTKTAGLNDILTFRWQFSMNGQEVNAEQFRKIVEEKREFVRVGAEWFRIDAHWLTEMRQLMEQAEEEEWTVRDLLFRELPENLTEPIEDEEDAERDNPLFAFDMQQSLKHYLEQLQSKQGLPELPPPASLQATLRPYQQQGFEWLAFMREQRFGACLADDMGLGKTVQLISYILYTVDTLNVADPAIVICPTSVLGNWQKELARFAPTLQVYTHYGANRVKEEAFQEMIARERPHIILSTYGTISQDAEFLQPIPWSTVVLDEAQNIKVRPYGTYMIA